MKNVGYKRVRGYDPVFVKQIHICVSVHVNYVLRERERGLTGANNGHLWVEEMWVTFSFCLSIFLTFSTMKVCPTTLKKIEVMKTKTKHASDCKTCPTASLSSIAQLWADVSPVSDRSWEPPKTQLFPCRLLEREEDRRSTPDTAFNKPGRLTLCAYSVFMTCPKFDFLSP